MDNKYVYDLVLVLVKKRAFSVVLAALKENAFSKYSVAQQRATPSALDLVEECSPRATRATGTDRASNRVMG